MTYGIDLKLKKRLMDKADVYSAAATSQEVWVWWKRRMWGMVRGIPRMGFSKIKLRCLR